ncbi:hypothetical protein HY382_00470 [Candidatus Curtissbacteria bacterium]|nr:hypothetical protein [Candidatus Curtissbacteria bacterium]
MSKPKTYLEPQSQPVIDGKLDESSKVNKESKTSIEKLAEKLPYRETITTATGTEVRFAIIGDAKSPYTLYIEIFGIDFLNDYSDPALPKNVQDFRDTAKGILGWINKQGADPSKIFISWGEKQYEREAAKAWLEPSDKYPSVTKKGDSFVFEKEPTK